MHTYYRGIYVGMRPQVNGGRYKKGVLLGGIKEELSQLGRYEKNKMVNITATNSRGGAYLLITGYAENFRVLAEVL